MTSEIITIPGMANSYLIKSGGKFSLVDTGMFTNRAAVEKALLAAGCQPGNLALIVLTHGDSDHAGNARYLGQKFGVKIGMHEDDAGMVERGDMGWNRKIGKVARFLFALPFFRLGKSDRFTPDVSLVDGQDLAEYGFDARIVHLPGHSKGSIGILTGSGACFCGDLFENRKEPALNSIMDDMQAAKGSLEKLKRLGAATIYPGHGRSFPLEM